jgi:hypothetical protein
MTTTDLAGAIWIPVAVTPHILGNQWQVVLPANGSPQFYQLQK